VTATEANGIRQKKAHGTGREAAQSGSGGVAKHRGVVFFAFIGGGCVKGWCSACRAGAEHGGVVLSICRAGVEHGGVVFSICRAGSMEGWCSAYAGLVLSMEGWCSA